MLNGSDDGQILAYADYSYWWVPSNTYWFVMLAPNKQSCLSSLKASHKIIKQIRVGNNIANPAEFCLSRFLRSRNTSDILQRTQQYNCHILCKILVGWQYYYWPQDVFFNWKWEWRIRMYLDMNVPNKSGISWTAVLPCILCIIPLVTSTFSLR